MNGTIIEQICPLIVYCPECGGTRRGTSLKRSVLVELLDSGDDVRVFGGQCGHIWSLTEAEKKSLRKALSEGRL